MKLPVYLVALSTPSTVALAHDMSTWMANTTFAKFYIVRVYYKEMNKDLVMPSNTQAVRMRVHKI